MARHMHFKGQTQQKNREQSGQDQCYAHMDDAEREDEVKHKHLSRDRMCRMFLVDAMRWYKHGYEAVTVREFNIASMEVYALFHTMSCFQMKEFLFWQDYALPWTKSLFSVVQNSTDSCNPDFEAPRTSSVSLNRDRIQYLNHLKEVWGLLNTEFDNFPKFFRLPDPFPQCFMHCLAVVFTEVEPIEMVFRKYQMQSRKEVRVWPGVFTGVEDSYETTIHQIATLSGRPKHKYWCPCLWHSRILAALCKNTPQCCNPQRRQIPVHVLWTNIVPFYSSTGCAEVDRKDIQFLWYMQDCVSKDASLKVLDTPIGLAVVRHVWANVQIAFYCQLAFQFSFVILLLLFSLRTHRKQVPEHALLWVLAIAETCSLFNKIVEVLECGRLFGTIKPLLRTPYIINSILEVLTVVFLINVALESPVWKGSRFQTRPIQFACVILAKWSQFTMHCFLADSLGRIVLPVWEAAKSTPSLMFLRFWLAGCLAAAHAYYSIPIDNDPSKITWQKALMRMYQLVAGHFDLWELEDVDEVIENATTIDEGPPKYFHTEFRMLMLFTTFLGTTVFLNIYIGLLSMEYTRSTNHIDAYTSRYKSTFLLRALLRREVMSRVFRRVCCLWASDIDDSGTSTDSDDADVARGTWITIYDDGKQLANTDDHQLTKVKNYTRRHLAQASRSMKQATRQFNSTRDFSSNKSQALEERFDAFEARITNILENFTDKTPR